MRSAALYAAMASAATILLSIALSQTLLGVAILLLALSGERFRFPSIHWPLALFFLVTVIAVLTSGHIFHGLPQIRKFFVFGIALTVASTFKGVSHAKLLLALWTGVASASAILALFQFRHRYVEAHARGANDYGFYLDARLTGFASHWMTFGGELMIVFIMLFSFAVFSDGTKLRVAAALCLPLLWVALLLGLTRSIFLLGVPAGVTYLLWHWRRWSIASLPAAVVLAIVVAPFQVKERIASVVQPHSVVEHSGHVEQVDSNLRRVILARTGLAMIHAHPMLGIGPEQIGPQFMQYVPADVAKPLPKGWYGHLHNVYLQYAAERGIPALLIMMWLIAKLFYDLQQAARKTSRAQGKWVLYGAAASIIAVLAEGFFEYNLGDSEVLTMFLAAVSCGYAVKWAAEGGDAAVCAPQEVAAGSRA